MKTITPHTRCGRCGKLFHEHPRHRNGKVGRWEVGHTVDGDNRFPVRIEHSVCNRAAGGRAGNAKRWGQNRANASPRSGDSERFPHYPGHFSLDDPTSIGAPPCVVYGGRMCSTCRDFRARNPTSKG
jgi:hypothetical protein